MQITKDEILFIYNSDNLRERTARAYLSASSGFAIKELDLTKDFLTERQLAEIAQRLEVPVEQLFHQQETLEDIPANDMLKLLRNNPAIMRTPIAVYQDRAEFVQSQFDFNDRQVQMKYPPVDDPGDVAAKK